MGVIVASLVLFIPSSAVAREGKNVLKDAVYEVSPAPNARAAPDSDRDILTDGDLPARVFWKRMNVAGWQHVSPVVMRFKLDGPESIDTVIVSDTASQRSNVHFPAQYLVYGGDGSEGYRFLATSSLEDASAWTLPRDSRDVKIGFDPVQVQEVIVVVYPQGRMIFVGEVQAHRSAAPGQPMRPEGRSEDSLRDHAARRRRDAVANIEAPKPTGESLARRWSIPNALLGETAEDEASGGVCEIERVNPWDLATTARHETLSTLVGGRGYAAWRVVNAGSTASDVKIDAVGSNEDVRLRTYVLGNVQALDYSWQPDVVTPFSRFDLAPHAHAYILAEVEPEAALERQLGVTLTCGAHEMNDGLSIRALSLAAETPPVYGSLWPWLHGPKGAVVRDALTCDQDALGKLGANVGVVPIDALVSEAGEYPTALLRTYLRQYRKMDRLMLYMRADHSRWEIAEMSDAQLRKAVSDWWSWVERTAYEEDYRGELILYPVDEAWEQTLPLLRRVAGVVRELKLPVRLYATSGRQSTTDALLDFDILQVAPDAQPTDRAAFEGELHSYRTEQSGRLLSPNEYYRLQGWEAVRADFDGVGAWSIHDTPGLESPETGWSPFGYSERDFGLIYSAPEGCVWPSRRILAWRRGIEDNRILRQCGTAIAEISRIEQRSQTSGARVVDEFLDTVTAECAGE